MRKDGEVTFYTLQAKYIQEDKHPIHYRHWFFHTDNDGCWWVAGKLVLPKNKNDDPTACGNIWQEFGFFGVTNKKAAERWLRKTIRYHEKALQKSYPKKKEQDYYRCKWRVVRRIIIQKTEPIMEIINY